MDITDLIYKKYYIKKRLKGYITKRNSIINNNIEDDKEDERLDLINMNIDELTKLLKVIKLMIKNYNTIEDIINFQEDFY